MTFGTKLRQCRERKRLSQQEVANYLAVGQSTYSQWESDQSSFKVDYLIKLAELYHVEIAELIPARKPTSNVDTKGSHSEAVVPNLFQEILEAKNELIRMLREENTRLKSLIY